MRVTSNKIRPHEKFLYRYCIEYVVIDKFK